MSDLHKSKRYDLIDMFNNTSGYLDDTDTPSITLNLRNIFLIYIQQNYSWTKQRLQNKETSFLDLNIKVIGSENGKRNDFRFPIIS